MKATIMAYVTIIVGILALLMGIGLLMAFPIKWTWNATMPYLFGLQTLTWGKAWCLAFLSSCLIRSLNYGTLFNNKK